MLSTPHTELPPVTPGTPRQEKRGYVTSYGEGRDCAHPGCHTALSRYNDSKLCWQHREGVEERSPTKTTREPPRAAVTAMLADPDVPALVEAGCVWVTHDGGQAGEQ